MRYADSIGEAILAPPLRTLQAASPADEQGFTGTGGAPCWSWRRRWLRSWPGPSSAAASLP